VGLDLDDEAWVCGGAARRFQNEVEVGMIGINAPIPAPMAYDSFSG
jgi:malonate-semialdehyde dehydrogenase (acetylating) / methylmalonate-semialdehyde dehydrogenase